MRFKATVMPLVMPDLWQLNNCVPYICKMCAILGKLLLFTATVLHVTQAPLISATTQTTSAICSITTVVAMGWWGWWCSWSLPSWALTRAWGWASAM